MSDREMDALIEASVTAYRERDSEGRIKPPSAWWDLPPEALDALFEQQVLMREMERAVDERGRTATVRAVWERMGPWGQAEG